MSYYAGLDISMKETAVCEKGRTLRCAIFKLFRRMSAKVALGNINRTSQGTAPFSQFTTVLPDDSAATFELKAHNSIVHGRVKEAVLTVKVTDDLYNDTILRNFLTKNQVRLNVGCPCPGSGNHYDHVGYSWE